jgi:hypothetical protein
LRRHATRLISRVRTIIIDERFRPNDAKTRVMPAWTRQRVGGMVVNAATNVSRDEYDRLRAILHDALRNGPAAANRTGHPRFAEHLLGRITWVAAGNPTRGAGLRAAYDRVPWE